MGDLILPDEDAAGTLRIDNVSRDFPAPGQASLIGRHEN